MVETMSDPIQNDYLDRLCQLSTDPALQEYTEEYYPYNQLIEIDTGIIGWKGSPNDTWFWQDSSGSFDRLVISWFDMPEAYQEREGTAESYLVNDYVRIWINELFQIPPYKHFQLVNCPIFSIYIENNSPPAFPGNLQFKFLLSNFEIKFSDSHLLMANGWGGFHHHVLTNFNPYPTDSEGNALWTLIKNSAANPVPVNLSFPSLQDVRTNKENWNSLQQIYGSGGGIGSTGGGADVIVVTPSANKNLMIHSLCCFVGASTATYTRFLFRLQNGGFNVFELGVSRMGNSEISLVSPIKNTGNGSLWVAVQQTGTATTWSCTAHGYEV